MTNLILDDCPISVPIIDYSLLTSDDPQKRSIAVDNLSKACQDLGVFMVVNHGIPESLMKGVIDEMNDFFNLPEEEKQEFAEKTGLDPVRYRSSRFNASKQNFISRDYVKVYNINPHFHFPSKPQGFRDIASEYSAKNREIARKLLGGISESLGLEESYLDKALDLESGLQIFNGNYYPPCPQPQLALGIEPHSDHGLLTLTIDNQVSGLQIEYQGKWINVNTHPNSIMVITSDQLEIFSNGKFKSSLHRVVVNDKVTRISIITPHGPSFETIVSPASALIEKENAAAAYIPMKYKDYLELQQTQKRLGKLGKSCLDLIMVSS